mmetsp:Transcript_40888/g.41761  ORF Transcript_40888/g.41761 Transcript_40888/m.41761 type:complete len:345 (-) Transcript_40888:42-1076(-)
MVSKEIIRLSLKKLTNLPLINILQGINSRSSGQLEMLRMVTKTRPVDILLHLYRDTDSFSTSVLSALNSESKIKYTEKYLASRFDTLEARHSMVIETLADVRRSIGNQESSLDKRINDFLWRHTGISLLLQQGLHKLSNKSYYPNCVGTDVNINSLLEDVKSEATILAEHHFNWCPEIVIVSTPIENITLTCIPSIYRFVLLELLKNGLYSTITHSESLSVTAAAAGGGSSAFTPYVKIHIMEMPEKVVVDIIDNGIGLSSNQTDSLFQFQSQHSIVPSDLVDVQTSYQPASRPMQGLGVGLSLSREYATHFGGALALSSDGIGHGATATLTIPKDINILEVLP